MIDVFRIGLFFEKNIPQKMGKPPFMLRLRSNTVTSFALLFIRFGKVSQNITSTKLWGYLLLLLPVTPLSGYSTDPGVTGSPASCLKEVIESAILNPLCYPNSYLAELYPKPLSLIFTDGAWLDSLPQVIDIRPNSESLRN